MTNSNTNTNSSNNNTLCYRNYSKDFDIKIVLPMFHFSVNANSEKKALKSVEILKLTKITFKKMVLSGWSKEKCKGFWASSNKCCYHQISQTWPGTQLEYFTTQMGEPLNWRLYKDNSSLGGQNMLESLKNLMELTLIFLI